MNSQVTSAIFGFLLMFGILGLVRRDHLHVKRAVWWIALALVVFILGFFPGIVDALGKALGVSYPPIMIVALGVAVLVIKSVLQDLEQTHLERQIKRLTQLLAIRESDDAFGKSGKGENLSD